MSFYRITDSDKRVRIIEDFLATRKRIQKQSFNALLNDKNICTQQENMFKPVIDPQKAESDKFPQSCKK